MSETLCYFKSGIGNLIAATPAFQALASMDPTGKVDFLIAPEHRKDSRYTAITDILTASPYVGRLLLLGQQNGCYRTYFVPVQSETSDAGHFVFQRSATPNSWPGARWLVEPVHEIEANMRYARLAGYRGPTPRPFVPVGSGPMLSGPRPYIGLCNSSFGSVVWEKKKWDYFPEMAALLKKEFGGTIFGIGGKGELAEVGGIVNLSGRLPILGTAKALAQLDLFITTDSGPMHIADALDVPLLALFGGTLTSKNGPVGRKSWHLRSKIPCAPCQYRPSFWACRTYECMRLIYPEDVLAAIRRLNLVHATNHTAAQAAR